MDKDTYLYLLRDTFLGGVFDGFEISEADVVAFETEIFSNWNIYNYGNFLLDNRVYHIDDYQQYIHALQNIPKFSNEEELKTLDDMKIHCMYKEICIFEENKGIKKRPRTKEEGELFLLSVRHILTPSEALRLGYSLFTTTDMDGYPYVVDVFHIDSHTDILEALEFATDGTVEFDIIEEDNSNGITDTQIMDLLFNDISEDHTGEDPEDFAETALEGCEDIIKQLSDRINKNTSKIKFYKSSGKKLLIDVKDYQVIN